MKYKIAFILLVLGSEYCFGQRDTYHVQDGFNAFHRKYGHHKFHRKISYDINEWPSNVTEFIRVQYENIPLLTEMSMDADKVGVIGFTQAGELLEPIEGKYDWGGITRPGDNRPNKFGGWNRVKTIDGQYGWFFIKPGGFDHSLGSIVKREIPKPIPNNTDSDSPIGAIIVIVIIICGVSAFFLLASPTTSKPESSSPSYSSSSYSSSDSYGYSDSSDYSHSTDDSASYSSDSSDPSDSSEQESGRERCPDCEIDISGFSFTSKGDGRCRNCNGTGVVNEPGVEFITLGLEDSEYACKVCSHTGQCQTCGGTGYVYY